MEKTCPQLQFSTNYITHTMYGSRKYPNPHHGGNWKFPGGLEAQEIPEVRGVGQLRAHDCKYRESLARLKKIENSDNLPGKPF